MKKTMNTKTVAAFTVGKDGPTSAIITEAGTAPKDGLRGFLKRHPKALRFTSCEAATSAFYKIKEEL